MRPVALALVFGIGLGAVPAAGQSALEAEFFDGWARERYRRGRTEEALGLFLRAQRAAATDRGLYNIGVVADLAGETELAHAFFQAYLASEDPDPDRRAEARRRVEALSARLARVEVVTSPPGAEIFVDRKSLGAYGRTPRRVALPEGPHTLLLTLTSHEEAQVPVEVVQGELQRVEVRLAPLTGTLEVETEPAGGRVEVWGQVRGETRGAREARTATAGRALSLPVGIYRLRFAPEGRAPVEARVTIEAGRRERRRLVAPPANGPRGTLLVNAASPAVVHIDGVRRATTPARLDLPAGRYRVEVGTGPTAWQGEIEVRPDQVHLVRAGPVR